MVDDVPASTAIHNTKRQPDGKTVTIQTVRTNGLLLKNSLRDAAYGCTVCEKGKNSSLSLSCTAVQY